MTEKLLPCPFCGGEAREAVGMMAFVDVEISCAECCATGGNESEGTLAENRAAAIAAWNRRTPAPEGEVVCSGCEGHPTFPNVPCAVCGASPVVPVGREEIAAILAAAFEDHQRGAAAPGDGLFDFTAKRILAALGTTDQGSRSKASVPTEGHDTAVLGGGPRRLKWPEKGTRLRFLGQNGYDFQLQEALRVLNAGAVYTCSDCSVGDWEHSVALEDVPGRFNGVMFEIVADPANPIPGGYEPSSANEPNPATDTGGEG